MTVRKKPSVRPAATTEPAHDVAPPWDKQTCLALIDQLWLLRRSMLALEQQLQGRLHPVLAQHRTSARNLVHYLSLRSVDLRELQEQLAWLGLSSLGRSESHVLANLDKVLGLLHRLTQQPWADHSPDEPAGRISSRALLRDNTERLLGPAPEGRAARIMVTLPSHAAHDFDAVRDLVEAGMDSARINCAHDSARDWQAMAQNVRRAAQLSHREIRILMDLAGPKIRTGPIGPASPVLKLKPAKDQFGRVFRAARLHLRPIHSQHSPPDVDDSIGVWDVWLDRLKTGTSIEFIDARGAKRHLLVVYKDDKGAIAEGLQTAYLTPETLLVTGAGSGGKKKHSTLVCQISNQPAVLLLHRGDWLRLTDGSPQSDTPDDETPTREEAVLQIACTLPQVITQVQVGAPIWFDDGRIGGVVREKHAHHLGIEIIHARDGGEKLGGDKGINLPGSTLDLPALTDKDQADLQTVAQEADLVGLSFVQQPADIQQVLQLLGQAGRSDIGLVLKIETLQAFENLPELILSAMTAGSAGIMIARGDLAIECGFERMAEVQEEILCCAESAHMPVIWATQVLESLAKTGLASRAEISDAGLGVRAECVMLNKGPYITQAIRSLDDILRRMAGHQAKKRPLLRALHAWINTATVKTA